VIPAFRSAATGRGITVKGIAKAVVSHAALLMALAATAGAQPPVLIGFEEREARLAVCRAVERAAARLAQFRDGDRAAALGWPSCTFATQSTEAGQASEMAPHVRVRGVGARLVAIINDATAQSETFRGLVDQINHTDGMVYVAEGDCGSGVRACLLLRMTMMGPHRVLRIQVDGRVADRDLMASIGHELQHAVEVLSYHFVRSSSQMILLYRRICDVCGRFFETNAAVRAGDGVRDELR
jgi:hypothetical protein